MGQIGCLTFRILQISRFTKFPLLFDPSPKINSIQNAPKCPKNILYTFINLYLLVELFLREGAQ